MLTLVAFLTFLSTSYSACFNGFLSPTSSGGKLFLNGGRFKMKGIAWFGFETSNKVVHGLWERGYKGMLDILATNNFNALRLPFSLDLALHDGRPSGIDSSKNPSLNGKTSLQILDEIIVEAGKRGILVMLDMHSLGPDAYNSNGLWYDNKFSTTQNLDGWKKMVNRYKKYRNVFAIDVFNEPFDATWGDGAKTDFQKWGQTVGNMVHGMGVNWLIVVQGGTKHPSCGSNPCFYAENLQGLKNARVILKKPNRVVYSPHVYGPGVHAQPYFSRGNFPQNMPAIWDAHFGFVRKQKYNAALVVGEWGGKTNGADKTWQDAFISYLISIDARDTFYWVLNANSGDTGGLLSANWQTVEQSRLNLVKRLQPSPTKICFNGGIVGAQQPSKPTARQPTAKQPTSLKPTSRPTSVAQPTKSVDVRMRVHKGSNQWWLAVWFEHKSNGAAYGVQRAYAQGKGSGWVSGKKQSWGGWLFETGGNGFRLPITARFETSSKQYIGCGTIQGIPANGGIYTKGIYSGTSCAGKQMAQSEVGVGESNGASGTGDSSSSEKKPVNMVAIVLGLCGGVCLILTVCFVWMRMNSKKKREIDDIQKQKLLNNAIDYNPPQAVE